MPSRNDLLNEVITKLFKLSDKSKGKYNEVLEEFKIRTLDQIQHLSDKLLPKFLNKIDLNLRTGSKKMGNLYTNKKFDEDVDNLFFRQAVKLAQEKEEKPKEESAPEEPKEETVPEETQEEETQEEEVEKKIEDVVKDLQVGIIEKFKEVQSFKPGRSEAINFRNAVKKLIEVSESAVNSVNEFYEKELGKGEETQEEDEK